MKRVKRERAKFVCAGQRGTEQDIERGGANRSGSEPCLVTVSRIESDSWGRVVEG